MEWEGSGMACIKSKDNATKGILNFLEFSHIIFTYAMAESTANDSICKQECSL